jgi:hypothetical protein
MDKSEHLASIWIVKFISVQDIQPSLVGLIELWEDYNYMSLCGDMWCQHVHPSNKPDFLHNYTGILTQGPPQLLRILQACRIGPSRPPFTFVRLVLDLSWAEMREAICYLRPVIGEDKGGLWELFYYAPPPLFPDIAYDYLRAMRFIVEHELPWIFVQVVLLICFSPRFECNF